MVNPKIFTSRTQNKNWSNQNSLKMPKMEKITYELRARMAISDFCTVLEVKYPQIDLSQNSSSDTIQ